MNYSLNPESQKRLKGLRDQVAHAERVSRRELRYKQMDDEFKEAKKSGEITYLTTDSNNENTSLYYDGRWGKFSPDGEVQRVNDLVRVANERHIGALFSSFPKIQQCVSTEYGQFREETIDQHQNTIQALVALFLVNCSHSAYEFCNYYSNPLAKTETACFRTYAAYLESIVNEMKNPQLSQAILPYVIEIVQTTHQDILNMILGLPFPSQKRESQQLDKYLKEIQRISAQIKERKILTSPSYQNQDVNQKNTYFFYITASQWWTGDLQSVVVGSHAPQLNWVCYFPGRTYESHGGVLIVQDKVLQSFGSDMGSNEGELKIASEWTPQKGAELQADKVLIGRRKDEWGLPSWECSTYDSVYDELTEVGERWWCKQDLEKSWDMTLNEDGKQVAYTEDWLLNARAYGIWFIHNWQEKCFTEARKKHLLELIHSRPDLPIIEVGTGKIVSRNEATTFLAPF